MDRFISQLADTVKINRNFLSAYERLQIYSLGSLTGNKAVTDYDEAKKLAQSAVIFSQTDSPELHAVAQDIAYALSETTTDPLVLTACAEVLSAIGNFPASAFLKDVKNCLSESVPWNMQLERLGRELRNTVKIRNRDVLLTDFQIDVWNHLGSSSQAVVVRAPTSAGKSFILQSYLLERFSEAKEGLNVAYVIPSRALLHEVQGKLSVLFKDFPREVRITSVPQVGSASNDFQIFVLTQERLHTLFDNSSIAVDEMIIDEAQQIEDDERGVLLQHCLEEALIRRTQAKMIFITPGRQDATGIPSLIGADSIAVAQSGLRPVRQNLIHVDFSSENPTSFSLRLHRPGKAPLPIGELETGWGFEAAESRLIGAVIELGKEGQSLVYAPSKSPAESIATTIAGYQTPRSDHADQLKELADFIAKHIHPKYALVECVQAGVGFHYGSMPTALTKAMEDYFDDGYLKYLVCTSTLLHGVNLPARNLFLYRPTKGLDTPLDADGFWNLAGRAGRMGKDIQGNVFLVDYDSWESKPVNETSVVRVEPALHRALLHNKTELFNYARSQDQKSGDKDTDFFESVFSRLCIDFAAGRIDKTLANIVGSDEALALDYKELIAQAMKSVKLPHEVIKKSRLVSPIRQQALFEYFLTKIDKGQIEDLIPLHPLAEFSAGRTRLIRIFYRIDKHIRGRKNTNAAKYFSGLALRWMRGDSLKILIDSSVEYKVGKQNKDPSKLNYGTIIRALMTEIETELRFQYVRYTTCYLEVLKYAFADRGVVRSGEIPNLPLHLELGAASATMISCLELGMSRISANEASEAMANSRMSPEQVLNWIKRVPLEGSLSPIVVKEFRRLGLR